MLSRGQSMKTGLAVIVAVLALGALAVSPAAGDHHEKKKPKLNKGGIDQPGGAIKGIVKYGSKVSNTKKKIDMNSDTFCTGAHETPVPSQLHRVFGKNGEDNVLQNVFVWVSDGLGKKKFPKPAKAAVVDQVGCLYSPHVSGVAVGQGLDVLNSDKTTHNVNAKAGRKTEFNQSMGGGSKLRTKTFKKAKLIELKCDVHSWMTGYLHVVEHPFFAVTQDGGTFELTGLPPGEYELSFWHEYRRYKPDKEKITVTVEQDKTATVEVTYKSKKRKKKKKS